MTNTTDNRNFQSGNSKYKSKKKNNSPGKFILALIILLAVGYYFLNPFIKSEGVDIDGPIIIEELIYETPSENIEEGGRTYVVSGHKIVLSFITDKLDTINGKDFDEIAEKINFTSSNFSDYTYQLNNGIIYPCDEEVILRWGNEIPNHDSDFENFKFELNSNLISIGSGNIVNKVKIVERDHFENFIKHEDSDCLTMVEIIEVTEPDPKNNCHFYVYTNHPNNLRNDSIIEADSTVLTYFDNGEKEYVEISISGKNGKYLLQNEFEFDSTMTLLNVWARTNKNSTPVFFTGNGKLVEGCKKTIEGCTNPKAPNYNPNATIDNGSCEEEDIFISNSDEKTQASPKNKNKNFTCNKCGTKMPIKNRVLGNENISISCKIDIITDLVKESLQDGETNRLEKHWNYDMSGTKCIFNGSDVTSSWWGIFRAENLKLESISLNRDGTIKVLKINN